MKVLIRDDKTRKYLAREGVWVAEAMEGMAFPSLRAAGQKAREHEDCDVVLGYEDPPCEVALNPVYCV
jgi:hypothetical protein